MKKPSLPEIVLSKTLPNPKGNDPTTFFGHVQRNLVPEVRHEVQVFYGSLDCLEAQYPGLDYTHTPHRKRLSRYPWHRRLFRTFDELGLTENEILSLCQWEGTRSAKERYEIETKRRIIDTTADDIVPAPATDGPRGRFFNWTESENSCSAGMAAQSDMMDVETEAEQSDEDEPVSSIGVQLNQQLQMAVEARSRGEEATVDAQWEQWMKEALERNDLDRDTIVQAIREGRSLSDMSSVSNGNRSGSRNSSGAVMLNTDSNTAVNADAPVPEPPFTQRYDQMRSLLSNMQTRNDRLAADNAQLAMLLSRSQPEPAR